VQILEGTGERLIADAVHGASFTRCSGTIHNIAAR
jgi:hypothetical protein